MTTCEKCGGKLLEAGELPDGVCGHAPGCPDGLVCAHGSLKRACNECENAERIAELERQLAESRSEAKLWEETCSRHSGEAIRVEGENLELRRKNDALQGALVDSRAEVGRLEKVKVERDQAAQMLTTAKGIIKNLEDSRGRARRRAERLAELMPKPTAAGVMFGTTWLSWEKILGELFTDKNSIVRQGMIAWANEVDKALARKES